jgi:hypothetical protein
VDDAGLRFRGDAIEVHAVVGEGRVARSDRHETCARAHEHSKHQQAHFLWPKTRVFCAHTRCGHFPGSGRALLLRRAASVNADKEVARIVLPFSAPLEHRDVLARIASRRPHLSWALWRYQRWLEESSPEAVLPLTPDVEFARHTHRLAPLDFRQRGRPELDSGVAASSSTRVAEHKTLVEMTAPRGQVRVAPEWMHLHRSMKSQRSFAEKMAVPLSRMTDSSWPQMLDHYSKFLALFPKAHGKTLVPTLTLDFCWHTHMQRHEQYVRDSTRVAGKIIDHDDSISASRLESTYCFAR